jgi:hypothetical protein
MHIEIEFHGDIGLKAEQYMSVLEQLEMWSKTNQIEVKMAYSDPVLTVFLPAKEDYSIWVLTWLDPYILYRDGWEA